MSLILLGSAVFTVLVLLLSLLVLQARLLLLPIETVTITLNKTRTLHAKTGQKLLTVLNDSGIPIPSACAGVGTCGLCKVIVTEGAGDLLVTEASRIPAADQRKGVRLSCQVVVRNSLKLRINENILGAGNFQCIVHSTRNLSPLIKEIVLEIPEGQKMELQPGSFVQITAPPYSCRISDIFIDEPQRATWSRLGISQLLASSSESTTRAYSIANRPCDSGKIVLFIRLALPPPGHQSDYPPGVVSSWLFSVKKGMTVEVIGPYNDFHIQDNHRDMVFIGGGVGMAPLRSMIQSELDSGSTRLMSFYYGARSLEDLFYAEEFDALQSRYENFVWTTVLSDPGANDNWNGPVGFVHEVVQQQHILKHPRPDRCDYYLCGPPLMQRAVVAILDDAGVDIEHIYSDDFGL